MAARCMTCQHPARKEIEMAMASGVEHAEIADRWSLPRSSLRRHAENHLNPLLAQVGAQIYNEQLTDLSNDQAREQALADFSSYHAFAARVIRLIDHAEEWLELAQEAQAQDETGDANVKFKAAMSALLEGIKLQSSVQGWTKPTVAVQVNNAAPVDHATGLPAEAMKIVFEELDKAGQNDLADRISAKLAGFTGEMIDVTPDDSAA